MREVRKKSYIPIYGVAAVCLIYCLFFPLYKLFHFIILAVLLVLSYFVLSKIFPGTVEYIEEPVTTGNPEHDALLEEGKKAVSEMKRIKESITDTAVKAKVDRLIELTDKIFADLKDDPNDYKMIKRFSNYFLPTTIKLLNAYDRMGEINVNGENINATKQRINEILDTTVTAYEKQYDALFANQALDIETDIIVLENMLKKEGLSSASDF
ncbi:MAG: 5-bromo-4-chloroindolyl phosphate hydrolysis family protein [Oscillospiraceae bacterium]|nr:5-bromo-4-chloroindolyl phosphate hydrolysis family protein [Oscillospiraceae bacterium]